MQDALAKDVRVLKHSADDICSPEQVCFSVGVWLLYPPGYFSEDYDAADIVFAPSMRRRRAHDRLELENTFEHTKV